MDILPAGEIDSQAWDTFIQTSPQGSLYHLHGYISVLRPDWQALIVKEGVTWKGVMPFCINKKWRFRYVPQPLFTQYWGIAFAPDNSADVHRRFSLKRKIVSLIVDQFDKIDLFIQNFSPEFDYPLPFFWKEFQLTSKYTYQLDLAPEETALYAGLAKPLQRQIKKAIKQSFTYQITGDIKGLENLFRLNLAAGHNIMGTKSPAYQTMSNVWQYLHTSQLGYILEVYDPSGTLMAAGVFVRFGDKTLYLMGAYHPDHPASGAMSWLMWEAIRKAKQNGCKIFDFEGSMMEGVERFFRKFGAYPVHYLQIHKNQLPLLVRWIHAFR